MGLKRIYVVAKSFDQFRQFCSKQIAYDKHFIFINRAEQVMGIRNLAILSLVPEEDIPAELKDQLLIRNCAVVYEPLGG